MKKFIPLALLLSVFSLSTIAQERSDVRKPGRQSFSKEVVRQTPEAMAKKRTEMLDKELKFDAKQRNEVYKMQLEEAKKFQKKHEIRSKEKEIDRKDRIAQKEKFEKLLTPDQKKVWKEKLQHSKISKKKHAVRSQDSLRNKKPSKIERRK